MATQNNTYTHLTAQNLLNTLGISLTPNQLQDQLQSDTGYYKHWLNLPALAIYNKLLLSHCKEIQSHCQEQLWEVTPKESIDLDEEKTLPPISTAGEEVHVIERELGIANEEFEPLISKTSEISEKIDALSKQQFEEWKQLQSQHAETITKTLKENGVTLSEKFQDTLFHYLLEDGAGCDISEDVIKSAKAKGEVTGVVKAVIAALQTEDAQTQKDNFSTVRKLLPTLDNKNNELIKKQKTDSEQLYQEGIGLRTELTDSHIKLRRMAMNLEIISREEKATEKVEKVLPELPEIFPPPLGLTKPIS